MFVWTDLTWIDHAQWHNFMKISYPYGGTVNFQICPDVQLTIHPPPMLNSSQTSAWSHRYIGRGNGKTEIPLLDSERISEDWISKTDGSLIGFIAILWRLKICNFSEKRRAGYIDAPRWIHRRRAAAGYTYADALNRTQQFLEGHQGCDTCARTEPILET